MMPKQFARRSMARQFTFSYLFISIIPVLFLFILVIFGTKVTHNHLSELISNSTYDLNQFAEHHMQGQGERIIQSKSEDVAKQVEIYFRMHPEKNIEEMRKDPFFMDLAIQKVGQTGYTAITEAFTHLVRAHPNPKLIDQDIRLFAENIPSFWDIVEKADKGIATSGYYDWIEPNGSMRKKYMALTPVKFPLNDGTLLVAATTYIDEFSLPIVTMQKKADGIVQHNQIYMHRLWLTTGIVAVAVIILSFCGTYFLGRRVAFRFIRPIVELADTARQYGKGRWDVKGHENIMGRKDEIGTLAQAFNNMSKQLRELFDRLESKLEELKKTQKALKESETHYRSLFDGVPVGLYRSAPDGSILDVNTTLSQMLGYADKESFLSLKAEDFYVNAEDRATWRRQMDSNNNVHTFDTRMKKLDGTEIHIENQARAVRNTSGEVICYEGSLKDITERKQAEAALKNSQERLKQLYAKSKRAEEVYRSLIHSSADAIMIFDLNLKATYTSPMFTKIFGWTTNELRSGQTAFVPDSEWKATTHRIKDVIQNGTPCQGFETKRMGKDGQLIEVSISASRYNDHTGNPAGLLVILRNISGKKRLEAQLKHIERMEAIGTLAGGIAHDFNNLLMAIQGSVSLMRYGLKPSDPNYKNFLNIEKQVERGSSLTSQLLGYARKGKYKIRPVNLNEVLKESAETFQRTRKGISMHCDLSADVLPIKADINQIEQVIMNIFINASDAMNEVGDLYLTTHNVLSDTMTHKAYIPKPGDYVMLKIRDTGTGMDQKTMGRIFDPFFTTKEMGRGTGLGLASAYGIIKGHGGYIDVESVQNQGTTFKIYLPATRQAIQESFVEPLKPTRGNGTILLIDDESLILDVGANMLSALGYTVLTADSGPQAVETFKNHIGQIDLVILDMIMPDVSGGTTFDHIREIDPHAAVLLSSGYSIDGKAQQIMDRGCNGFMQKPYSIEKLSEKIEEIIRAA